MTNPVNPLFAPNYSDQLGIFDPDMFAEDVVIIGCGGIGATLIPVLVTLGIKRFVLYDPDKVETRNIASQLLYKPADLYRSKVEVCKEYILAYGDSEVTVETHERLFTEKDHVNASLVISAVDSQQARRGIWAAIDKMRVKPQLLIDGRIGGLIANCLFVKPHDADWYTSDWLGDNVAALPCARRAIIYPSVGLAEMITNGIVQWAAGEELPRRIYRDAETFRQQVIWEPSED